jgi:prenylcysteine oxidase/farnesylcysteine lyase
LQVRSLVRSLVTSFVALYGAEFQRKGPFSHPVAFADALNLSGMFEQDVQAYFDGQGVGQAFVSDFVGAAVRVNYGQSPASIHALEGLVALAAEGASSVQGGNRRIFERFVAESRATVRLETAVAEVVRLDGSQGWLIPGQGVFDVVLLAAPYHQSGLRIGGARVAHVPEQAYVHLHVTLVLTSAPAPKGEFYAEAFRGKPAPRTVLSTFAYADAGLKRRPRLNSHNALRRVDGKWLYKRAQPLLSSIVFLDSLASLFQGPRRRRSAGRPVRP